MPRVVDGADRVLVLQAFLLESQQQLVLRLHQGDVALVLEEARRFHDLVAPHERVLLVLLSEVELGDQSVVGGSEEDSRKLLAELEGSHILIEAFSELAALLHLPQVPEHHLLGSTTS